MREIQIDKGRGIPEGFLPVNLASVADIENFIEVYSPLKESKKIYLNVILLPSQFMARLLKFLEETHHTVTLLAKDPVLPTILSRFEKFIKDPLKQKPTDDFLVVKINQLSVSDKIKDNLKELRR